MTAVVNTWTMELRNAYRTNLSGGLLCAGVIHMLIFAAFMLDTTEEIGKGKIIVRGWPELPTSVSFNNFTFHPTIAPKFTINSNSVGIPIPIPDPEFNPETTIPIAEHNGNSNGVVVGTGDESGTGTGEVGGISVSDEETPPKDFIPGVEKFPVIISNPAPMYPDIARRAGVEGTVFVKMWVAKDGTVKRAEVIKSTSELFDQAAVDAARRWKFMPAIMNNSPVSVFVTVPFKFRLQAG